MRVFVLLVLLSCLITIPTVNAQQPLKKKQVPTVVRKAFKTKVPHTKAKWQLEPKLFEAVYKKSGELLEVGFDSLGTWQFSATEIERKAVPDEVMTALSKAEYGKWDIYKTYRLQTPQYAELYRVIYRKNKTQISAVLLPSGNMVFKKQGEVE